MRYHLFYVFIGKYFLSLDGLSSPSPADVAALRFSPAWRLRLTPDFTASSDAFLSVSLFQGLHRAFTLAGPLHSQGPLALGLLTRSPPCAGHSVRSGGACGLRVRP